MIALRVAALTFAVIMAVALNGSLVLTWITWLPNHTLLAIGLPDEELKYLVYDVVIGLGYGGLALCFGLQVFRPHRNVAALWFLGFFLGAQMVYDAIYGTVGNPLWWLMYSLTILVVVLHPRRFAPLKPFHTPSLAAAAIGAGPMLWYAWTELDKQTIPAEDNFYFGTALYAVIVVGSCLIGASSLPGSRVLAWIGGISPVLLGVTSLAHPGLRSAMPTVWSWLAIGWGLVYIAAIIGRVTERRRSLSRTPDVPLVATGVQSG